MKVDRNGVPWFRAPLPRRWHRCKVHSSGVMSAGPLFGLLVERCACGAIRIRVSGSKGSWLERNSRKV